VGFDPARRFDKIDRVIIMLLDAGADSENIGIKNNIFWRESASARAPTACS
jgi:hypothetical protein